MQHCEVYSEMCVLSSPLGEREPDFKVPLSGRGTLSEGYITGMHPLFFYIGLRIVVLHPLIGRNLLNIEPQSASTRKNAVAMSI